MGSARRRLGLSEALAAVLTLGTLGAADAAPAMWSVSDADSRVYLFGSVHVLPAGTEWRTPAFDAALDASPEVYFETDIGPWGEIALTMKMIGLAAASAQNRWVDQLTVDQLKQLDDAVALAGIKLEQVKIYPPWVLESELSMAALNRKGEKLNPFEGVDASLEWQLPKERKAFFETPGQQFDFLAGDPIDVQIKNLFNAIGEMQGSTVTLDSIVDAWSKGDVEAIAATNVATTPEDVAENQRLLFGRNSAWVPTIEKLLAENRQDLIVVGAAHLAGPGSVLDLLAKAGYTVSRIQ